LMDQYQKVLTRNSIHWVLNQLAQLQLLCVSAGNVFTSPADVDRIVNGVFFDNVPSVTLDQFTQRVMGQISNPQAGPAWKMLLDCMGLFPYFYYNYFCNVELLARLEKLPPSFRPRKEGFLIKEATRKLTTDWNRHWTIVQNGFFCYYPAHNEFDEFSRVLFLGDASIEIIDGATDPPYQFQIIQGAFRRTFCAEDEDSLQYWVHVLKANTSQAKHRYHSFSPVRERIQGRWFVDGVETYEEMEKAMESAKEEIFITDWFFSPQVYLKRFDENGNPRMDQHHRLDKLLKRKADEGVQIYVLPWSETKIAIDLGSANVKQVLESLSPNIHVLCHPLIAPIKWSHHQKTVIVDQKIAFVGGLDLCFGRWDTQKHLLTDNGVVQVHPGKDYYNPAVSEFANVQEPWGDLLNRDKDPRMPWHDIHMMCVGEAARDVAVNFIQRWNHHRDCLNAHKYIAPKASHLQSNGTLQIQVIRSICEWSCGGPYTESSILNAYLAEIEKAERFIYIENQFFISSNASKTGFVENTISKALLDKVCKAAEQGKTFKIIVIVPVHPEGGYKDTATVRYIMGWQFKTICRGGNSMVETFARRFPGVDVTQYFHFYIVKNWAKLGNSLVSEQIYVHAKLMIVDDRTVIVGSANINDRSMIGVRDSEIGVVIGDNEMMQTTMDGQPFNVSKFAHTLRCNLFCEHLGLSPNEVNMVRDPICPQTYGLWLNTARENTIIFNEVFWKERTVAFDESKHQKLQQIRGHLAEFDQDFLTDAEMDKTQGIDTMLASDDVFT